MKLPDIPQEPTPKGKRTIRNNIWGNTVGYVSGKRWCEFGPTYSAGVEEAAEAWKNGESESC